MTYSRRFRNIATAALLLISAYFLAGAGEDGSHHWHLVSGNAQYFPYIYSERVRFIVCGTWILAAVRFAYFRWFPVSILALVIAWLFNPLIPAVTGGLGRRPYYGPTMILSLTAAVALLALTYKNWRVVSE